MVVGRAKRYQRARASSHASMVQLGFGCGGGGVAFHEAVSGRRMYGYTIIAKRRVANLAVGHRLRHSTRSVCMSQRRMVGSAVRARWYQRARLRRVNCQLCIRLARGDALAGGATRGWRMLP